MRFSKRVVIRYLETMPGRRKDVGRSTEIGKKEQQVSWGQRQDKDKAGKASHHVLPLRRHRGIPGIQSTMCCHYGDIKESPGSPVDRTLSALTARGLGSVPARGTKIPKVKGHGQIK